MSIDTAYDTRMPPEPGLAEGETTTCANADPDHVDEHHRDCGICGGIVCTAVDDPAIGCDLAGPGSPLHRECHDTECRDDRCWTDC